MAPWLTPAPKPFCVQKALAVGDECGLACTQGSYTKTLAVIILQTSFLTLFDNFNHIELKPTWLVCAN